MKKNLLRFSFLAGSFLLGAAAHAQADRFAYAITDVAKEGYNWSVLRRIDLSSNTFSDVLLNGADMNAQLYDASGKKALAAQQDAVYGRLANAPFGTGVAALAYDKKNNRLWYTPMLLDQLRFVDLSTMQVSVVDLPLTGGRQKASDQSDIITRMVIGEDGNGYAVTNDGKQVFRFAAGKKGTIQVTSLGSLTDAQENKGVSIFNSCTSYGGDIVADDDGHLYLFSARNHVFKIDIETRVATHLGAVTGLPAGFSMNGAAVTERNTVLLTSATDNSGMFEMDVKTLTVTPVKAAGIPWRTSDLANSNLLKSGKKDIGIPDVIANAGTGNGFAEVFPNPVTTRQFTLQFNQAQPGNYTVQILDGYGKEVSRQQVSITNKGQVAAIRMPAVTTSGIYLVKVTDNQRKAVFSDKLMVQ